MRLLDSDEPFFSLKLTYRGDSLIGAILNGERIEPSRARIYRIAGK